MDNASLSISAQDSLKYVTRRQVIQLFKEFLFLMEKSQDKHIEALDKLSAALPPEQRVYVDLADWWTEEEFERMRKEILQRGNDAIRTISEEIDKYDVQLR